MRRHLLVPAVVAGGLLAPSTAGAEIVKAPTGERSTVKVNSATLKTFKKHKLKFSASGQATKSGASTLTMPYSISRWDFGTREGDVAHFAKNTGFRLKRGKRSVLVVHPRLVLDTSRSGYVTALIRNERIKFFTVSGTAAKAADVGNVQQITGYRLKLTQAGANYVNKALKRKALKRFSRFGTMDVRLIKPPSAPSTPGASAPSGSATVTPGLLGALPGGGTITPLLPGTQIDTDGDGKPDSGVSILPIDEANVDLDTNTGTIDLGGGLVINAPALGTEVSLVDPQIVLGATPDASGLFASINGVRVKVGDIDTEKLDVNLLDGTVTISSLDVTVSGAAAPVLQGILGTPLIQSGTPLLSLDLQFPKL
jgi:hypothetical protein